MSTERSPGAGNERGITHSFQTAEGLHGKPPSFHKEANTLWQGWDQAIANSNHPGTRTLEGKRKQGQEIDDRVHRTPVSRPQIDHLKAERDKAQLHSRLIPKGPGVAHVHSAQHSERERTISFQEKRLARQQDVARSSFDASSKAQIKGPMRSPDRGPQR